MCCAVHSEGLVVMKELVPEKGWLSREGQLCSFAGEGQRAVLHVAIFDEGAWGARYDVFQERR